MDRFTVNIHDIFPCGLLRLISPQELVEGLRLTLSGRKVEVIDWGSEEGRINFCTFSVDGVEVYYQVCGLFAGDEYFEFKEGTPKRLIDEVLAVWEQLAADALSEHLGAEHTVEIGGAKVKILTPEEALVEGDARKRAEYLAKRRAEIAMARLEASRVLEGKASFFDRKLKNYKRRQTLGEVMVEIAEMSDRIDKVVERALAGEPDEVRFLVKEYLEWRVKLTGLETIYRNFKEKVESRHRCLSTLPERGWGQLNDEQRRQLAYFESAMADKELFRRVVRIGNDLVPQVVGKKA